MRKFPVLLCLVLGLPASLLADKIFVEMGRGNAYDVEPEALTSLVRSAVSDVGSHTVVSSRAKADYVLQPKIVQLGNALVMTLEKKKGSRVIFASRLKAREVEELDEISGRLVRAVLNNVRASKDTRVHDVTINETTKGTRRRQARKGTYLGFGPVTFANLNSTGVGFYLSGGYGWDVGPAMVRARGDFSIRGSAIFSDVGLGLNYFFTDKDVAPFVGAEFGYGLAKLDGGSLFSDDTVTGFVVGPTAGLQLFRTSTLNLEIAFRAVWMLASGALGRPFMGALRVGLYF